MIVFLCGQFGCDIPARHDIEFLREPASWEQVTDAKDVTVPSASLASLVRSSPDEQDQISELKQEFDWTEWTLHRFQPSPLVKPARSPAIVGGAVLESKVVTDATKGTPQVELQLLERTLVVDGPITFLTANQQRLLQSPDGSLIKADYESRRGPLLMVRHVEVEPAAVTMESRAGATVQRLNQEYDQYITGPLVAYQALRKRPLAKGEQFEASIWLSIQGQVGKLKLSGDAPVPGWRLIDDGSPTGDLEMLPLRQATASVDVPGVGSRKRYFWYDDNGIVHATMNDGESQVTYRVDEESYARMGKRFEDFSVPLEIVIPGKPIPELADTDKTIKQIGFEVTCLSPLNSSVYQYAQRLNRPSTDEPFKQKIIVSSEPVPKSRFGKRFLQYEGEPTDFDIQPTSLLNFQHPAVRRLSNITAKGLNFTQTERAEELCRAVHSLLTFSPLSSGLKPCSEVAQSSSADSTEQSLLLMGLLRASQIPSRLVVGLKHQPDPSANREQGNRFVYHCWVLAHVDDQWIKLDPVAGGHTGADCLAIQTHDMTQVTTAEFFDRYYLALRARRFRIFAVVAK